MGDDPSQRTRSSEESGNGPPPAVLEKGRTSPLMQIYSDLASSPRTIPHIYPAPPDVDINPIHEAGTKGA